MNVNKKLIIRLSRYSNSLKRFKSLGFVKVFSDNIADAVGITPSQVRKDFSIYGLHGNKRGGYQIDELIEQIDNILGKNIVNDVIVVGSGNLGKALLKYEIFKKERIRIVAGFDIDPNKINEKSDIPIYHLDKLESYVTKNKINIGIITVPDTSAQTVTDIMVGAGIKGILNFSPVKLRVNDNIIINNIYLQTELESLIYFVNAGIKNN